MTSPASKRILVTGATGLIGRSVAARLRHAGYQVTATFWNGCPPDLGPEVVWRQVDLRRSGSLGDLSAQSAIAHCAATLPARFDRSGEEAAANLAIDDSVFGQAESWASALVYASGASLYDQAESPGGTAGWCEHDPISPSGAYLLQKAAAEERGLKLAQRTGAPFTALRISAPYGPGQAGKTVLQRFMRQALAGEPLKYLGRGTRRQDFTYVDDVAEAFEAALKGTGGIYNIATGRPITMCGLASLVAELAGAGPDVIMASGEPDPQEGWPARFDISRARQVLGWAPRTSLRQGITHCLRILSGEQT